eukprot:14034904-Alexandrium_andersonii.AAC.2
MKHWSAASAERLASRSRQQGSREALKRPASTAPSRAAGNLSAQAWRTRSMVRPLGSEVRPGRPWPEKG